MLGFLLLLGFAWLMRHSILRKAASLWIISDRIAQADAIVVLGGRSDLRPGAAAELYKCGLAPQILVPDGQEVNRTMLLRGGIPSGAIVSYGNGVSSTYDEAHAVNDWATQSEAKRIIVITEIFGGRRVRWIFNRALRRKRRTGSGAGSHAGAVQHGRLVANARRNISVLERGGQIFLLSAEILIVLQQILWS